MYLFGFTNHLSHHHNPIKSGTTYNTIVRNNSYCVHRSSHMTTHPNNYYPSIHLRPCLQSLPTHHPTANFPNTASKAPSTAAISSTSKIAPAPSNPKPRIVPSAQIRVRVRDLNLEMPRSARHPRKRLSTMS